MTIYKTIEISDKILNSFKPTRLYVKELNGIKYFGKTVKLDITAYSGSSTVWKRIIKKYGKHNIKNLWVSDWFYDPYHIQEFALMFSEYNCIVESTDWANLIPENGIDGGTTTKHLNTLESNIKKGNTQRGISCPQRGRKGIPVPAKCKPKSIETRQKMCKPKSDSAIANMTIANKANGNTRSKKFKINNILTNTTYNDISLSHFSKIENLSYVVVWEYAKKNKLYKNWKFVAN